MATSGTTTWTINRNEIITASLRKLRIINAAETAPAADITTGAEAYRRRDGIGVVPLALLGP